MIILFLTKLRQRAREFDMKKGEITVYLSLLFVLLISFVMGVLEAAIVQTEKNMCRLKADRAVFSVFGVSSLFCCSSTVFPIPTGKGGWFQHWYFRSVGCLP